MFPQKVYLGKWQHAKDEQMIKTLGITHILNISDSCENYLEGSDRKCLIVCDVFTTWSHRNSVIFNDAQFLNFLNLLPLLMIQKYS